ncbi:MULTISPECIES: hypothetical protein [Terrisporobacter]|uniref:Uncharacterized protein n=2 Tax=Terrisporobacter TaxID=1505652 RepID=A0AAX2ZEX7_9FIRM|nr:hypothetical protein [Terrisporobacter hibernicus]UEL46252.1 hypothetical protein JW646_11360 [Terrisporobacter hibernicus]
MLRTPLEYILVRTFPECAIVLLVGCYFLNLRISIKTLLKKTLILGIIQSGIRMLPISFGIHTIIGMALVLFMLVDMSKDTFINCIMALCKIFICLILSESIYVKILVDFLSVPKSSLINNYTIMGAIYSLPSLIIFVVLSILVKFILRKFQGVSSIEPNK